MGVFDDLDHEWHQPPMRRHLRRRYPDWADRHPALAYAADAHGLIADLRHRTSSDCDPALGALVALAADDQLAARVVLQALLPGLKTLAARHASLGSVDEVDAVVVAAAWAQIRRYPPRRHPRCIAANILGATGRDIRRQLRVDGQPPSRYLADVSSNPAEELHDIVIAAVTNGHLRLADAQLILRTRVLGVSVADIAAAAGRPENTIRRRRARAERRLREVA